MTPAVCERQVSGHNSEPLCVPNWRIGGLRPKGLSPGLRTPMYPYVAPRTAKIHTLISLGISIRTQWLVFWLRTHRPCGFDSHRPLHFSLAHIGLRCPRLGARTFPCSHSMDASSFSRRLSPRKLLHSELPGIGHGAANLVTKVANADFCT